MVHDDLPDPPPLACGLSCESVIVTSVGSWAVLGGESHDSLLRVGHKGVKGGWSKKAHPETRDSAEVVPVSLTDKHDSLCG